MKTIFIEESLKAAGTFEAMVQQIPEVHMIGSFQNDWSVLHFMEHNAVDLVVVEADAKKADGMFLAKYLRRQYPNVMVIVISDTADYAMEAFQIHAAAYLLKPYTKEEFAYAVNSACLLSKRKKKGVFVKTFGHFDVFVNNTPIMFRSGKAKELLALLVDRQGGTVSTDQIICALWEERPNDEATQSLCSKVCKGLCRELTEYGIQDMFVTNHGSRRVNVDLFECDLYQFLEGREHARRQFVGDYLLDYSWAEERMGQLNHYLLS